MSSVWAEQEFDSAIVRNPIGRQNQIAAGEYKSEGAYPIVDQGQSFIAGFTDDESKVASEGLPYIIFGDHTRCFKYVDFAFVLGADGTKVLKPKADLFDPRFFYFALLGLSIPNRGYNRHYTLLREKKLPRPGLDEQRQITRVLATVQQVIAQQQTLITTTRELKRGLMHKLFTEGLRGEPQKPTEIGLVPESWEVVPLGQFARIGNGSTPKRTNADYWKDGHLPWLTSGKIHEGVITEADEFVTALAAKECHLPTVPCGSVLVAITGQGKTLGNAALVTFDTHINQHLACITFSGSAFHAPFVFRYLQSRYEHLRSIGRAGGSTKAALTCGYLKSMAVPKPDLDEQVEIAEAFAVIDDNLALAERKRAHYADLFKTLLHQLMTAQLRVHELDLDALGVPALD